MNKQQIEQMAEEIVRKHFLNYKHEPLINAMVEMYEAAAGKESEGEAPSGEGEKMAEGKFYPVEYSGYWLIQAGEYYGDDDILDAEDVGEEEAEGYAKLIASLLNKHYSQLEAGKAPESAALIPTDEELEDMVMDGYAKTDKNKERVRVAKVVRDRIAERFKPIQSNK